MRILLALLLFTTSLHGEWRESEIGLPKTQGALVVHPHYTVDFNVDRKIPNWVAYHLTKEDLLIKRKRRGSWRKDPNINSYEQASNKDYLRSGYDKGHLVPSADMVRSAKAMQNTFLFTNAAPQIGRGFNRTIWMYLEKRVRTWAVEWDEVWVYAGTYFVQGRKKTIGDDVYVPHRWYKIVYTPHPVHRVIAFEFKNKKHKSRDYYKYKVSVDYLEKKTKLDFLSELPDDIEVLLESGTNKW